MNKHKSKQFGAILIMLIAFAISIGILNNNIKLSDKKNIPKAQNGVLDLRGFDFEKSGMIPLNGQWDFYYGQFINPNEFANKNVSEKTGEINIPGNFNGYKYKDKKLDGNGFATYRLKVITDKKQSYYGLKTQFILTAHKLWAGGEVISSNGVLGKSKNNTVSQLLPQTGIFYSNSEEFDIVLQVSNFQTRTAQIDDIFIGTKNQVLNYTNGKIGFDFFILGSTLIMALYHFGLYLKKRKYKATLYFGILCAIISLRTIFIGERFFVSVFPYFNFTIYMKLCYLTFFMYIPFLILFIENFYPNTISKKILKLSNISGIIYFILVLILPISLYDALILPFEIISLILLLYTSLRLIMEYYTNSFQYKLIIFSMLVVVITSANDILYEYSIIQTASYAVLGLLIFIIAQSYVLVGRFSEVMSSFEDKSKELTQMIEYDKFKTDFFVNISHELRTPLNVVYGTVQLLKTVKRECLVSDDNIQQYLNSMSQNCLRLTRLTNNLIDSIRIDGDFLALNLMTGNIIYVVEEITLSVADYVKNKGIMLIFDTDVEEKLMCFDQDKIERIILNLLSNAIKFTKDKGSICVSIFDLGESIRISVQDNGIGIPRENLEKIFHRFTQVDSSLSRSKEGSGIGLALVKSLVELHSGTIKVNSEIGKGSEFIIELPVKTLKESPTTSLMHDVAMCENSEKINIEFSDIYK